MGNRVKHPERAQAELDLILDALAWFYEASVLPEGPSKEERMQNASVVARRLLREHLEGFDK